MSKRILLIDSDETFARSLQGSLEGRGLAVQLATNSEQGMALAKSEGPDLIVVCVEAQPTNGYMLCTRLKKDEQLKLVPVILTSANATPDSFEKHKKLKTRAEEYLIKPFEPPALLHRIGALLRIDIPPAPPPEEEQIVSMEDEPLGLGDLVGEDEPVHLTDSEAAEAHAGSPPSNSDVELDNVEVEEVLSETPAEQSHDAPTHASDEDLDMLDAAFDALSPASRPPQPRPAQVHAVAHEAYLAEVAPETTGPIQSDAVHHLETRVRELEEQVAAKDAELESSKKGQSSAAELRKLKEARSKADKENVRLKEELNEKEKELIELRDQQAALEHQAHTLEDDAAKREIAAKALQQRAEALAAAAKKFERELGASREELKSVAALKARVAELEKSDAAFQDLQQKHTELQGELELHKVASEEHQADARANAVESAQHQERAARFEAELADTRAQHENELTSAREQHQADLAELQTQLGAHQATAQKLGAELEAAHAKHGEAIAAAEGELTLAREAHEKTQGELTQARAASEKIQSELAEARAAAEKISSDLEAAQLSGMKAEDEMAALKGAAEKIQGEVAQAQAASEKLRAELAAAHEEAEKTQLELLGAQEQLEQARAETAAALGDKTQVSDERDELRRQLDEAHAASARNEQRAVEAYQRIKGDEKLREKTKKALQIALQLLDEVQSLPEEAQADEPHIEQQSA